MSEIKDDHPNVARCAAIIRKFPNGIRSKDIAETLRFSSDKVNRLLTINRRLGVIKLWGRLWVAPEFFEALSIAKVAEAKRIKSIREKERMCLRRLKAHEPPPPPRTNKLHAPNSVWQLADFL